MSNALLLFFGPGRPFDKETIRGFWTRCPGVSNLREPGGSGAVLEAHFTCRADRTIIYLAESLETIVLFGTGDASVEMAFRLQSIFSEPLHVIDQNYEFDLIIREYATAELLAKAMHTEMTL